MEEYPEFTYDEKERTVSLATDEKSVQIYSDVSREEYEIINEVDEFVTEASTLPNRMFRLTVHQRRFVEKGTYFDQLNELQQQTGEYYQQCIEYQEELSKTKSEPVTAQLGVLYKLEKFLKHYFRALTISQSLGFSQRWGLDYMKTGDYGYLYGFVRNTCSTIEYLGNLIESRMGEDRFDLADESVNAEDVYEEIKRQELDDVFNPEQVVRIPPTNYEIKMEDIGLSAGSMNYLWEKRCDIVHECPLVVSEEDIDHLPAEIVSTSVITESDVKKLAHFSFRLHFHSVSIFLNYTLSYLKNMVTALVEALYYEQ